MSLELLSLILLVGMVILLAIGVEVFAAVGLTAAIGLLLFVGQPLDWLAFTAFEAMNSFTLTALPLFIFMGAIISTSGIVTPLFDAVDKWTRNLPGGLVISVIGANALFGAMCGSTTAATATFGKIAYPELERKGYNPRLALGSIAVGGVLSAAIPPSLTLIVYGAWVQMSIPRLFAGVLIPGIILALLLMLTVIVQVKLNPNLAPKPAASTWREKLAGIGHLFPWIATILLILGAIFGGIMTPTEAAALGVVLSVVLAVAYRRMSLTTLKESMWTTVKITSMLAFIIFTAMVLSQVFQHVGLTELFSEFVLGLPFGKYGKLAVIALIYLIGGMFLSDWALLLLTIPFVLPVVTGLGFSTIWFGVWFVMVGETGLITPPFGLHLFVLHSIVPKHEVTTIALGVLPFLIPMLAVAVIITAFPQLVSWLPSILY